MKYLENFVSLEYMYMIHVYDPVKPSFYRSGDNRHYFLHNQALRALHGLVL